METEFSGAQFIGYGFPHVMLSQVLGVDYTMILDGLIPAIKKFIKPGHT